MLTTLIHVQLAWIGMYNWKILYYIKQDILFERLWRRDPGDLTVMEDPCVTSSGNLHTYAKPKERPGNFIERIGFTMFFEMDILFLFILVNIFRNRKISHVIRNIIGTGSYVSIHYLTLLEKKSLEVAQVIRIIAKTYIIIISLDEIRSTIIYIIKSINITVLPI